MGDVRDFRNFMGAVIDERAFKKIGEYIGDATQERDGSSPAASTKGDEGYFIAPTLVETTISATIASCARRSSARW